MKNTFFKNVYHWSIINKTKFNILRQSFFIEIEIPDEAVSLVDMKDKLVYLYY